MALPAAPTLPAPPAMIGGDDKSRQEYFDALQKTLDALDARANRGPNWFQLAGALLDPGRTGNVGEALGRSATILGEQQQRQSEMQLPIAQVRAQLAGQKYEVENQAKALGLLSQTLGTTPDKVQDALASGQTSPDMLSKLAQVYPVIAQLSPKVAEIVKGTFSMQKDMGTLALENKKFIVQSAQADRSAGMTQGELIAKYGPGILALLPGGGMPITPAQPAGAPTTPPASAPAVTPVPGQGVTPPLGASVSPASSPMGPQPATTDPAVLPVLGRVQELRKLLTTTQDPTLAANARDQLQRLEAELSTRFGITLPPMPMPPQSAGAPSTAGVAPQPAVRPSTVPADLQNLPLATQAEVMKGRVEAAEKPYIAKRDEILAYTPQALESSNTELRKLDQIARQYPQIFALMQQQGVMSGLLTAAQEGAQAQAGTYNARLGLPVQQFLEKVKLKPEEQQAVREVGRIIGTEFLNNVRANKGLLGVNPTDNDARLLQAPMASIQDSAKAVQLWSRTQLLLNKQREALYGAMSEYQTQQPTGTSLSKFFSPNSEYARINQEYAKLRMQLFRQFYPDTPR